MVMRADGLIEVTDAMIMGRVTLGVWVCVLLGAGLVIFGVAFFILSTLYCLLDRYTKLRHKSIYLEEPEQVRAKIKNTKSCAWCIMLVIIIVSWCPVKWGGSMVVRGIETIRMIDDDFSVREEVVTDKRCEHMSQSSDGALGDSYYLKMSECGEYEVDHDEYDSYEVGTKVFIVIHNDEIKTVYNEKYYVYVGEKEVK